MSTARIVSLVTGGVAFVAAIVLFAYGQSLSTITVIGGQLAFDRDAAALASTLGVVAFICLLIGLGGIIAFAALTARDRKAAEAASEA